MIEGKKFSQVYLDKGKPIKDSMRMRNRLSAYYWNTLHNYQNNIAKIIEIETGAKVPSGYETYILTDFIEKCNIRDLLDSITLIYQYLLDAGEGRLAFQWHQFVTKVFKEENVGYRLDKEGGVHFFIDEEFERNRSSLIAGVGTQPAVKEAFEKSYSFLDQDPPDTASSVKSIFEALEILYKHIVDAKDKDRLNSHGIQKLLKPILQKSLADNQIGSTAADHLMDGLCDWVDAGHMYRHGQKVEEPLPPPLDFAVLFISQGACYVRYLLPFAQSDSQGE